MDTHVQVDYYIYHNWYYNIIPRLHAPIVENLMFALWAIILIQIIITDTCTDYINELIPIVPVLILIW